MKQPRLAVIRYKAQDGAVLDGLLAKVAARLAAHGLHLAGAVQRNTHNGDRCRCDMTLEDLRTGRRIEISEKRGENARGCRLDQSALEEAVGLVLASIEHGADLLIVNKFGKRECEGHGFRSAVEAAIAAEIPILASVSDANIKGWNDFVQDLAVTLTPDEDAIYRWCIDAIDGTDTIGAIGAAPAPEHAASE